MRVIGGEFRSRLLSAPAGTATRPTSDRLRETLFNVLGTQVSGARFADLYAGSGAVGIEALSRGAAETVFAEKARDALTAIRANLRALGIVDRVRIEAGGTAGLLAAAIAAQRPFDIVFLDPPYEAATEYHRTLTTLGAAPVGSLLHEDSIVVAEHTRRQPLLAEFGTLAATRTILQGDAALTFFRPRSQSETEA